jgi:hypothetical protein
MKDHNDIIDVQEKTVLETINKLTWFVAYCSLSELYDMRVHRKSQIHNALIYQIIRES